MNNLISDFPAPRRIKDWAEADRPREKLLSGGRLSLSDTELVAILIGQGYKEVSALDLARKLMLQCENDLNRLGKLNTAELAQIKGIGLAKATTIAAALELGRRRKEIMSHLHEPLRSSKDIYHSYRHKFEDLQHEELHVLLLNHACKAIACNPISVGGVSATIVDLRKIFREVVQFQASGLVLIHNHPSGILLPSEPDRKLTSKVSTACQLFEVKLIDHLIISNEGYYSFADQDEPSLFAPKAL